MTEKDLLNNKEAMKLALAFEKMAKEYKTTIPEMIAEGKRITEMIQKNHTDTIGVAPMVKKLVNKHEPDAEKREKMISLIDSLNMKGTPKVFSALTLAFFFTNDGVLTEE